MLKGRIIGLAVTMLLYSVPIQAQDANPASAMTSPVPSGRFEILQSPRAARLTFRLDRYSGRISQLVATKSDGLAWEDTPVVDGPKVAAPTRPRFQMFTSGIAARYTFMLDTDTGKAWQSVTSKEKGRDGADVESIIWQPFE